jgi:hypothetical protein
MRLLLCGMMPLLCGMLDLGGHDTSRLPSLYLVALVQLACNPTVHPYLHPCPHPSKVMMVILHSRAPRQIGKTTCCWLRARAKGGKGVRREGGRCTGAKL